MMLDFEDAGHEAAFKAQHQEMLPRTMQVASVLACLVILASAVPTLNTEGGRDEEDQFQFEMDDARMGWFLVCVSGLGVSMFCGLYATLKVNDLPLKALDHMEVLSLLCICLVANSIIFMNRWQIAVIYGQDPDELWVEDVRSSEGSVMLGIDICVTTVSLFIPIRVSRMWTVHVSVLLLLTINFMCFGSAFPQQTRTRMACMVVLAGLSYCGAWRNEAAARKQWRSLQKERNIVRLQKTEISKQQIEICESAALAKGMQTVLTGLCDMVFKISSGGTVLGQNASRDNAFGCRMEGRFLFDFFADTDCTKRFQGMLEVGHDTGLLQMKHFTCVRHGSNGKEPFDAELLVVEMAGLETTHRYIVGVRVLSEVFSCGDSLVDDLPAEARDILTALPNSVPPTEPSENGKFMPSCGQKYDWTDSRQRSKTAASEAHSESTEPSIMLVAEERLPTADRGHVVQTVAADYEDHPDTAKSVHLLRNVSPQRLATADRGHAVQTGAADHVDHPDVAKSVHLLRSLPSQRLTTADRGHVVQTGAADHEDHPDVAKSVHLLRNVSSQDQFREQPDVSAWGLPGSKQVLPPCSELYDERNLY